MEFTVVLAKVMNY